MPIYLHLNGMQGSPACCCCHRPTWSEAGVIDDKFFKLSNCGIRRDNATLFADIKIDFPTGFVVNPALTCNDPLVKQCEDILSLPRNLAATTSNTTKSLSTHDGGAVCDQERNSGAIEWSYIFYPDETYVDSCMCKANDFDSGDGLLVSIVFQQWCQIVRDPPITGGAVAYECMTGVSLTTSTICGEVEVVDDFHSLSNAYCYRAKGPMDISGGKEFQIPFYAARNTPADSDEYYLCDPATYPSYIIIKEP